MAAKDWANLARQVRERRDDLGLTQEDVAQAGGPSTATQRLIENQGATSYRAKTFRELETALMLPPGSVRAALKGGEFPLPGEDEPPAPQDATVEHLRSTPGLSPEVIRALEELARAMRGNNRAS